MAADLVSQSELARQVNVSRQHINRLIKSKALKVTLYYKNMVSLKEGLKAWQDYKNHYKDTINKI